MPEDTTEASSTSSRHNAGQMPPDHIGTLVASAVVGLLSWWGLYLLTTQTIPRVGQRWVFFMLLQIAVTGTAVPIIRFLNVRFTPVDHPLPSSNVILRQAVWVGLFTVTCAWLQIPRALTWSIAFFLAAVFAILESFLRIRERQEDTSAQ